MFFLYTNMVYNFCIRFLTEFSPTSFLFPNTPVQEGIVQLHGFIMIYGVAIIVFVFVLLIVIVWQFRIQSITEDSESDDFQTTGTDSDENGQGRIAFLSFLHKLRWFKHDTILEIVWTLIPAFILLSIAYPSLQLLYAMDEVIEPSLTIKVGGRQWFWNYVNSDKPDLAALKATFLNGSMPALDALQRTAWERSLERLTLKDVKTYQVNYYELFRLTVQQLVKQPSANGFYLAKLMRLIGSSDYAFNRSMMAEGAKKLRKGALYSTKWYAFIPNTINRLRGYTLYTPKEFFHMIKFTTFFGKRVSDYHMAFTKVFRSPLSGLSSKHTSLLEPSGRSKLALYDTYSDIVARPDLYLRRFVLPLFYWPARFFTGENFFLDLYNRRKEIGVIRDFVGLKRSFGRRFVIYYPPLEKSFLIFHCLRHSGLKTEQLRSALTLATPSNGTHQIISPDAYYNQFVSARANSFLAYMRRTVNADAYSHYARKKLHNIQAALFEQYPHNFRVSPMLKPVITAISSNDSYMVPDTALNVGDLRLLKVDKPLLVPFGAHIRFLVTSNDVLHSFAIPSAGIKIDAVPGRLNQVSAYFLHPGILFGQCSELCGVNHGFMPIQINVLSPKQYFNRLLSENFTFKFEQDPNCLYFKPVLQLLPEAYMFCDALPVSEFDVFKRILTVELGVYVKRLQTYMRQAAKSYAYFLTSAPDPYFRQYIANKLSETNISNDAKMFNPNAGLNIKITNWDAKAYIRGPQANKDWQLQKAVRQDIQNSVRALNERIERERKAAERLANQSKSR